MKKAAALLCCIFTVMVLLIPTANAATLTFEDLQSLAAVANPWYSYGKIAQAPNGYGGLNWQNLWVMDVNTYTWSPTSGYRNGAVSGAMVAYNSGGTSLSMLASSTPFTLHSAYLTGAWNNNLTVQAVGYRSNVQIYSKTVTVSALSPTLVSYDFANVDKITWNSWGGTNAGLGGSGNPFAMDNLSYELVPEPSQFLALLCGVGGMGGMVWRRRK
ncbi:MAG: PEP-CTERM sorting domain-containing protein [Armatimonadetes bacterium]|nr:PEP-CTERM sorting domain-containing protein [Armatimonadota bacterium]